MPPRDILLDPRLVVRGTTGPDAGWRWCARVLFPDREDRTLADLRRVADDAGFAPRLVTVRWPGMFLEDPLAVPGPGSWPAAAGPGYRPVWLGSWAGRWLPASR